MLIVIEVVIPLVVLIIFTSSLRLLREVGQYHTSNAFQPLSSGIGSI